MDTGKVLTQAVDYQKTLINNSYNLFTSLQDHGQQWIDNALENNSLIPEGGREIYAQWVDYLKQNNEICKEYVESSLDKVKDMFTEEKAKPAPAKPKTSKKAN